MTDVVASLNQQLDDEIQARRRRKIRHMIGVVIVGSVLWLLLFGCGASARQRAVRDAFTGVNVARSAFVDWDANHQNVIIDSCVADGNEEAECQRRLDAYRTSRAPVVEAFTLAYRAIAAAAIDTNTPMPTVLGIVADLAQAIAHLKGAL